MAKQTFADELKRWRAKLGITQVEAALRLQCNYDTYVGWEQSRHAPSLPTVIRAMMRRAEDEARHSRAS